MNLLKNVLKLIVMNEWIKFHEQMKSLRINNLHRGDYVFAFCLLGGLYRQK